MLEAVVLPAAGSISVTSSAARPGGEPTTHMRCAAVYLPAAAAPAAADLLRHILRKSAAAALLPGSAAAAQRPSRSVARQLATVSIDKTAGSGVLSFEVAIRTCDLQSEPVTGSLPMSGGSGDPYSNKSQILLFCPPMLQATAPAPLWQTPPCT